MFYAYKRTFVSHSCARLLLVVFTKVGFVDVTADIKLDVNITAGVKAAPRHLAPALYERSILATEDLPRNKTVIKEVKTTLKQNLDQTAKESRGGLNIAFTGYIVIGRKELVLRISK